MTNENRMSFREKSAWISLLSYLAFYGYYFWVLSSVVAAGRATSFGFGALLVRVMFLLVVVEVILQVAIALRAPHEAEAGADEREQLISLKATRVAFQVVMIGAAVVCAAIALSVPAFYTTNGLFLALVLAEVVRNATQVAYFRLDA